MLLLNKSIPFNQKLENNFQQPKYNVMKAYKLILSALALVTVLSVNSFAQVNADVDVTATAVTSISLTKTDVAFGNISTDIASVLKANISDIATEANLGTLAKAGSVSITGNATSEVIVTFGTATLSNGTETAVFTPSLYFGPTKVVDEAEITLTAGPDVLDIGGTLAATTAAGTYTTVTGTSASPLTVTVQYK